jgi:Xaa-Pro dipeptidase
MASDLMIPAAEYAVRRDRVRQEMERRGLDTLLIFHPIRIAYLTGFFHQITERPIVLVFAPDGRLGILVPALEQESSALVPGIDRVWSYPEYPTGGTRHPMRHLVDFLGDLGCTGSGARIGADNDGALDVNGYRGPLLSALLPSEVSLAMARDLVDDMRAVKSAAEIDLLSKACHWADVTHQIMQDAFAVGKNELQIAHEASYQGSLRMLDALGVDYQPASRGFFQPWCGMPAVVYLIAGARTAMPHSLSTADTGIQPGDVLVTFVAADVGGYQSELERTMFVGDPPAEFVRNFDMMLQLQTFAFSALTPGKRLADAEAEIVALFAELGVLDRQRHHSGHAIGLEGHEQPFIDLGDETVIQEGMVFTVEPGLYVPGLAGFRHSDTAVVRASGGAERLTQYPRDLASLVIPV